MIMYSVQVRGLLRATLEVSAYLLLLVCGLLAISLHVVPCDTFLKIAPLILGGAMFVALVFNRKNMLTILFLVYSLLVFLFAYSFYDESLAVEGGTLFLIVALSFLIGRSMSRVSFPLRFDPTLPRKNPEEAGALGDWVLYSGIAIRLAVALYLLSRYGVGEFFSGAYLADKIGEYDASEGVGPLQIVSQFGSLLCVVGIALRLHTAKRSKWLAFFVLAALPVITLQRGELVSGALCLTYLYRDRMKLRHFAVIGVAVVAIALFFGGLRAQKMDATLTSTPAATLPTDPILALPVLLLGELTVSQGIHQVIMLTHEQGLAYGSTLLGPTLTAEIPRAVFPWKPPLTAAIIMDRYDSVAAAHGFYLAVTVFGDWLYNFGYAGLAFVSCVLGGVITRVDKSSIGPFGVIFAFYYYPLLRDGFPRATCSILLCLIICWATKVEWGTSRLFARRASPELS
jgi:hypothetical protein